MIITAEENAETSLTFTPSSITAAAIAASRAPTFGSSSFPPSTPSSCPFPSTPPEGKEEAGEEKVAFLHSLN